jgi:hypothetical protein
MERFKGQAGFSWIEEVSAHLRVSLNMGKNPETIISYDDNAQLRGMHHFAQLHEYIRSRQPITVEYQPYKSTEQMKSVQSQCTILNIWYGSRRMVMPSSAST